MAARRAPGGRGGTAALGRRGEVEAAVFLERRGFTIVARNVRFPLGELDLVARHGHTLVFVEVKTRRAPAADPPQAAVDPRKQLRLARLAHAYLARHPAAGPRCRFDVVAVTFPREAAAKDAPHIEYFPDAFNVDGWTG